jgi:hypothetical protein
MGRTYRKNDRWKKDRRDQNFKKSKKFKDFKRGGFTPPKPVLPEVVEPKDSIDDSDS